MTKARIFAILSATMSAIFLGCILALIILLFVNWKLALCVIPLGLAAAPLAKYFNGLKLRKVYGNDAGSILNEFDWKSGRRTSTDPVLGLREVGETVSDMLKIRETYGRLSMEEEETLLSIHRLLDAGEGEWGTVVETDGVEYPAVTFRIRSYPHVRLADKTDEDCALLMVTMEQDRKRVKEYSLNQMDGN